MHVTNDEDRRLYDKFQVRRTDGSSEPGGKHEKCRYFVLDIDHDPNTLPVLLAYAAACEARFPLLAYDLKKIAGALQWKVATPAKPAEPIQHGVNCMKMDHFLDHRELVGYHGPNQDGPFKWLGKSWCGRCHVALPAEGSKS